MSKTYNEFRTQWEERCTPSYTMETYDKHGRIVKTEVLRTLSYEEFQFELERAQLPVADVHYETGPRRRQFTNLTMEGWYA